MTYRLGFGFDANQVSNKAMLECVRKEPEIFADFLEYLAINELKGNPEDYIREFIDDGAELDSEFLADIINDGEKDLAGTLSIVETYDNYIVFCGCDFYDDCPMLMKYIRNKTDFIRMIGKYIDTNEIRFGDVWENSDYDSTYYFIE